MAERLAAAATCGAKLVPVAGVGHGDFFRNEGEPLWRELGAWIGELPQTAGR